MILVTGGTGLVGSHLLYKLAEENAPVRAIYRSEEKRDQVLRLFKYYSENATELFDRISWMKANIRDISSLQLAFEGVERVYHCAAMISFDPNDFRELVKVNEEGTANVVNLCIAKGIGKLCYVSSIAALGRDPNKAEVTEQSEWKSNDVNPYALTKYLAEMEVWRGTQEGVPAVVVNPGVILGPGFWESGSGRLFKVAAKGGKYYPPGGTGFVSIHDVVEMMILLMNSAVVNERFISVSDNLTYKELLTTLALEFKKRAPHKMISIKLLQFLWRLDWFWHLISRKKRKLSKLQVEALKKRWIYNGEKIKEYVKFEYSDLEDNLTFYCQKFREEYPEHFP